MTITHRKSRAQLQRRPLFVDLGTLVAPVETTRNVRYLSCLAVVDYYASSSHDR